MVKYNLAVNLHKEAWRMEQEGHEVIVVDNLEFVETFLRYRGIAN